MNNQIRLLNFEVNNAMVNILKQTFLLFIVLVVFSCGSKEAKGPENVPGEEALARFDQVISSITGDLSIENYSYAILSNKDILKLGNQGIAVDEEIPADIMSGVFLSALLLQCSEDERIDVNSYMSEYGVKDNFAKAKIKNVLSYTNNGLPKYNPENNLPIYQLLETITEEEASRLFKSEIGKKLEMKNTNLLQKDGEIKCYSSLDDLVRFSMAIDNRRLFKEEDTHDLMLRPVYLETGERTPFGLGCNIDISNERKLMWKSGHSEGYSTFLLKSLTDSLSFVVVAKSNKFQDPFQLEAGELKNSPLYYAFLDVLPSDDTVKSTVNFYEDPAKIQSSIRKGIESGKRDAVYNELAAYLRMYAIANNNSRFDNLAGLYRKFFPLDLPLEKLLISPVAEINATMDYMKYKRSFTLEKDTSLLIFGTAEFAKQMILQPWEYDNVELYFDLNHERTTGFNGGQDDRQYRFNYDYPEFTGNAPSFEDITRVQNDVSPTQFNFEIAIPWKTLLNSDSLSPATDQKIGFDIAIADNDGQAREGSLAWHSKLNETPWSNTSLYGSMILTNSPGTSDDTICYAVSAAAPIQLDGKNGGEWNRAPRYAIDNEFMSGIKGSEDQSGWFRVQWDNDNLYFFVEIQDDVKRLIEKSGDYGWITNARQDTVWMLAEEISLPAGGGTSNRYIYTHLPLKAGEYTLHYQTNQSHSAGLWIRERPDLSFYGIVLYGAGQKAETMERKINLAANSKNK